MTCRTDCLCQCNQQGCGCLERPGPYVPKRPEAARKPPRSDERGEVALRDHRTCVRNSEGDSEGER